MNHLASSGFLTLLVSISILGALVATIFLLTMLVKEWRSGKLW
ncbi:MAG TPA: hypothetical protein P5572_07835 [Phycisphaerae bacterium]|nr:hypothetical protein [Phycisphaerae bacterium]